MARPAITVPLQLQMLSSEQAGPRSAVRPLGDAARAVEPLADLHAAGVLIKGKRT
jgi:hypothetical protein